MESNAVVSTVALPAYVVLVVAHDGTVMPAATEIPGGPMRFCTAYHLEWSKAAGKRAMRLLNRRLRTNTIEQSRGIKSFRLKRLATPLEIYALRQMASEEAHVIGFWTECQLDEDGDLSSRLIRWEDFSSLEDPEDESDHEVL